MHASSTAVTIVFCALAGCTATDGSSTAPLGARQATAAGQQHAPGDPRRNEPAPTTAPTAGQAIFPSGRVFALEVARTPEEQARGYMGRKEIPAEEGMLFPGSGPAIRKFWMKNCEVAIDMLWLDDLGRVLAIEHAAPPCRSEPCPVYGPDVASRDVLEVRGGEARKEKLKVGDRIEIHLDPE